MKHRIVADSDSSPMVERLRQATEPIHLRLHQHPLLVELLKRPSPAAYRTVLLGFHRFYAVSEQRLVNVAGDLQLGTLYSRPERTEWLTADLDALNCDVGQDDQSAAADFETETCDVGDFAGRLYVVRGSALGGRKILSLLSRDLDISDCCRFLNADGPDRVARDWRAFQQFCNQSCRCESLRTSAVKSAQSAFHAIEQCLTQALRQRDPHSVAIC